MKKKKSQVAIEFLIFLGVALIVLVVFSIINLTYLNLNLKQRETTNAQDLAKLIKNEINLASRVEPGYIRTITLPVKLDNKNYQINTVSREIYITFPNVDDVYSERLATNINPATINPDVNNVITIKKCYDVAETIKIDEEC